MGFEPTVPLGTRLFESRTFDHSDISPCIYLHISPQKHLGKRRELMERTKGYLLFNDSRKAPQNQGFSEVSFQKGHSFSSAAPSTTRTTLRVYFRPAFFPEICSKIRWRENRRDGKKYSILRFSVLRNIKENQGNENHRFCRNFESGPL